VVVNRTGRNRQLTSLAGTDSVLDEMNEPTHIAGDIHEPPGVNRLAAIAGVILLSSLALFIVLRAAWVGHLLMWDEAMELCAVRGWAAGAGDFTSAALWWHPPGFKALLRLVMPLAPGFAERAQIVSIGVAALNVLLLFILNRKIFGVFTALASVFLLAVTPGAIFFDVLVKQDGPVVTFGLIALILLLSRQPLYAGLSLGIALLFKETGVFYAVGALLLWATGAAGSRRWRDLSVLLLVPAASCGWWYLVIQPVVTGASLEIHGIGGWASAIWQRATVHLSWAAHSLGDWHRPWHYYILRLADDLGPIGTPLMAAGLAATVAMFVGRKSNPGSATSVFAPSALLWPAAVGIPALVILGMLSNKVPWVTMALFPAWATLQASGLQAAVSILRDSADRRRHGLSRLVVPSVIAATAAAAILLVAGRRYEDALGRMDAGQLACAQHSYEAALMTDRLVKHDDRLLLSSFYHWQGLPPAYPCVVWAWYTTVKPEVVMFPYQAPFAQITNMIESYRPDWVLVSPVPGAPKEEVMKHFRDDLGLTPTASTATAILYRLRRQ
jgi:4-amino-4-deoxy-L-arabinose transferase-like glycosyltransferase